MNATKFVVLLVIGVLCAVVSARVVEEMSKETKLGVSIPKTTTKGFGAELSAYGTTESYSSGNGYASATKGPRRPTSYASGNGYTSTRGYVAAKGRKARISSNSGSKARGSAGAEVSRKGAAAGGTGYGASSSHVKGSTYGKKKGHKGKKN